jgi:hypothetical protein
MSSADLRAFLKRLEACQDLPSVVAVFGYDSGDMREGQDNERLALSPAQQEDLALLAAEFRHAILVYRGGHAWRMCSSATGIPAAACPSPPHTGWTTCRISPITISGSDGPTATWTSPGSSMPSDLA